MAENDFIIIPHNDGPYEVRGKVTILSEGGRIIQQGETEAWLCRCGQSASKPFCDGTHSRIGFRSNLDAEPEPAASGEWEDVCSEADVREHELTGVRVAGQPVVIGRVGGELHAIGGVCSHQKALLEDGELEEGAARCPLHASAFDLKTGRPTRPPATEPVPAFAVKVEQGRVLVATRPK